MGIQGLLPFLKKIHSSVNISQFEGCTVAIDAYCWLHKGAFACAEKLAMGEETNQYVYYCLKYVNYMLSKNIKPILVFDGLHLPSKKGTEKTRRERREVYKKKAAQFLREGNRQEARECFQRCIDVTPKMALELITACQSRGIDCIVAPYEADAQLAYLSRSGIAQVIVTEDSDLLLFGCEKIIFKMDLFGNGVLIERSRLNEVTEIRNGFFTFEKFRHMCIMAGCDYLPSLPGIGLATANKVFKTARQTDIKLLLKKLPQYLKKSVIVPDEYVEQFVQADNTFLYQLTYDPLIRKLVPLTPYPPEIQANDVHYAGPYISEDEALQIALGNIDLHTRQKVAHYDPETQIQDNTHRRRNSSTHLHLLSIWDRNYRPKPKAVVLSERQTGGEEKLSTRGKEVKLDSSGLSRRFSLKRSREESVDTRSDKELYTMYKNDESEVDDMGDTPSKRSRLQPSLDTLEDVSECSIEENNGDSDFDTRADVIPDNKVSDVELDWSDWDKENSLSPKKKEPSPKKLMKNMFAVSPESLRKDRFNVNATKPKPSEVRSRFFASTKRKSLLLKSLVDTEESTEEINPVKDEIDVENDATVDENESVESANIDTSVKKNHDVDPQWEIHIKSEIFGLKTSKNNSTEVEYSAWLNQVNDESATVCVEASESCLSSVNDSSKTSTLDRNPFSVNTESVLKVKNPILEKNIKSPTSVKKTHTKNKVTPKQSKQSPVSAFNWSKFKFQKLTSAMNLSPLNSGARVSGSSKPARLNKSTSSPSSVYFTTNIKSESTANDTSAIDLTECDSNDAISLEEKFPRTFHNANDDDISNSLQTVVQSEEKCSQTSLHSQDNLCSIDSYCMSSVLDCDVSDISAVSSQSQSGSQQSSLASAPGNSQIKPGSVTPLQSSQNSSQRSTSSACRVSGLSKTRRRSSKGGKDISAVDNQANIRDMLSKFKSSTISRDEENTGMEGNTNLTLTPENTDCMIIDSNVNVARKILP